MVLSTTDITQQLIPIVGSEQVLPLSEIAILSTPKTEQLFNQGKLPLYIVFPRTQTELAAVVAEAHRQQWRLLICGQASKIHWGGLTQQVDLVVCTQSLNRVIAHAVGDLTVTVEAGLPLATLQTHLAQAKQYVALDPAYPAVATLGGLIATRDAGSLRHRYGSLRDMCLGVTFVRADGQLVKAGGRVVKNVAGYDLMKLMTGSYGTLGIISEVTLRLYPVLDTSSTVLVSGSEREIAELTRSLLRSSLTPTAVDLLTASSLQTWPISGDMGLAIRFQGGEESVTVQCDRIVQQSLDLSIQILESSQDSDFWQQRTQQFWQSPRPSVVVCKFGILPAQATRILSLFTQYGQQQGFSIQGRVHAGSGTGVLRLEHDSIGNEPSPAVEWIRALRSHCQQAQGFLTVLDAPPTFKQAIDVWGYTGNALASMRKLKQQFDPQNILNPERFVGGI